MASPEAQAWFQAVRTSNYEYVLLNVILCAKSRTDGEDTGLIIAAQRNDSRMVQILVDYEAGLTNSVGDTALITSIRHDHVYVCRILVAREYKIRTIDGLTPLMVAVKASSISCFPYLFPYLSTEKDYQGRTALDHAVIQRKFSCVMYLLNHKIFTKRDLECAMEIAVSMGTLYTKDILEQHLKAGEYLVPQVVSMSMGPLQTKSDIDNTPSMFGTRSLNNVTSDSRLRPTKSARGNDQYTGRSYTSPGVERSGSQERSRSEGTRSAKLGPGHQALRSTVVDLPASVPVLQSRNALREPLGEEQPDKIQDQTVDRLKETVVQQNAFIAELKAQVARLTAADKQASAIDYERVMTLITKYQHLKSEHKKHMKECTKGQKAKRVALCDAEVQCSADGTRSGAPGTAKLHLGQSDNNSAKADTAGRYPDSIATDSKDERDPDEIGPIIYASGMVSHSVHSKKSLNSREKLKIAESVAKKPSSNADIQRLRIESADLKRQICTLQSTNSTLQSQLLDARNQMHKLSTQNTSLNIRIAELEKQASKKERERRDTGAGGPQPGAPSNAVHGQPSTVGTPSRQKDGSKASKKRGDSVRYAEDHGADQGSAKDADPVESADGAVELGGIKSFREKSCYDPATPMTIEELGNRLLKTYESVTRNDELHLEIEQLRSDLKRMQLITMALLDEGTDRSTADDQVLRVRTGTDSAEVSERTHYINKAVLRTELARVLCPDQEVSTASAIEVTKLGATTCVKDERGNTPLMLAIYDSSIEELNKHIHLAGQTNNDGNTALMLAALMNRHKLVPALVEKEAMIRRYDGETALSLALQEEHYEVARILREYEGVPLNIPIERTNKAEWRIDRFTELIQAAEEDDIVGVWSYLEFQHGLRDEEGRTALMHAAECDSVESIILLLPYEKRLGDMKGQTALMHAAIHGNEECAKLLRRDEGRQQDINGWTALMHAVQEQAHPIVRLLARQEAGIKADNSGYTALILAIQKHDHVSVGILAELEGSICDATGMSPMNWIEREEKASEGSPQDLKVCQRMHRQLLGSASSSETSSGVSAACDSESDAQKELK